MTDADRPSDRWWPDGSDGGERPNGAETTTGDENRDQEKAEDESVEPVEVLVQLARNGEIDPWDVDVVQVTDKFLARLDRSDLVTSGRALFYASVLVRMKGEALLEDDPDDVQEDPPEPWEVELGMAPPPEDGPAPGGGDRPAEADPIDGLEREIQRRLDRKHARGTPETLDELVRELRDAERNIWWKESREYDTSDSPSGYRRGTQTLDYRRDDDLRAEGEPLEEEVTGTTHQEDVEATVSVVRRTLDEQYDAGRDEVLFDEVYDAGGSRVETYLGLLFLSHRGHVVLRQDELFGDLWIRDPAAPSVTGDGAVAD
jgi:segregation and condensation protein A